MITNSVFKFLDNLSKNNNRDWFHQNKKVYLSAKKEVEDLVHELIAAVYEFDSDVVNITVKDCMFRINRDIRFSKDKSPYKTNFGGFIASGGKKSSHAGYYLHIENNHSFVGGGIYCPPSDVLKAVRKEIFYNPGKFKAIINDPVFIEHFKEIWDDNKLKKGPKDFPKDFPDLELLKFRNYTVGHYMSNDVVISSDFFGYAVERFKAMFSLNRFINEAIDA